MTKVTPELIEGVTNSLLAKGFDDATATPDCHREWWDLCCRDHKFVAVAAPRGHAKSTAVTHSYVITKILFREAEFVVLVSDTESQSTLFLNDIKKEFTDNEDMIKLFGVEELAQWPKVTETDLIISFDDGHQVRIVAKGSGQAMRGLKWRGKRPDLIMCDDMENDEMVMNVDRRNKFKRWFSSTLLPIRSKNGIVRIVGTILHADSLLEGFMPRENDKATIIEPLRMYTTKPSSWLAVKYRAHDRDNKKFLWPTRHGPEELAQIRHMYVSQGLGDVYSQEYLNIPIDESLAFFKKSDFKHTDLRDKEKKLHYYVGFDLAVTEKQRADYSAFVVGGVDEDSNLHIRHVIRRRMDSLEIVDTIIELARAYDPLLFVAEKGTIANSILPVLRQKMSETGVFVNLELLAPTQDKVHRAHSIRARARAGKVKVDKEADWWPDLEDELTKFPRAVHDDQVDALAYLGLALNKLVEAPTKEEQDEDDYIEMKRAGMVSNEGRNQTTGY